MMSNEKAPFSMKVLETADGSPTLSLGGGEKMHSMEGALSESLYIYKPCLEAAFSQNEPSVLSMGLGLGYNELIATALELKLGKQCKICSFEIVPELRQFFRDFLLDESSPLTECYSSILQGIAQAFSLQIDELKQRAVIKLEDGTLRLHEELTSENPSPWLFHGILYDAFSGETDGYLWTQEHLESFLKEYADPDFCHLSTYAATGNLKRALLAQGFKVEKRKGFGKKRESTFASRQSEIC